METTNRAITVATQWRNHLGHRHNLRKWLTSWRGLVVVGAIAAAAAAVALDQQWLSARDLLPLLYLLPCAAMMAMCAKGMSQCDSQKPGSGKAQKGNSPSDRTSQT